MHTTLCGACDNVTCSSTSKRFTWIIVAEALFLPPLFTVSFLCPNVFSFPHFLPPSLSRVFCVISLFSSSLSEIEKSLLNSISCSLILYYVVFSPHRINFKIIGSKAMNNLLYICPPCKWIVIYNCIEIPQFGAFPTICWLQETVRVFLLRT